ncbi:DUF805 domain-containing protein [Rhizobium sp. BK377]|uniref:DUF805 domain-containing protein n=1 Tax=Rhizobium sp. BK377 TaxID=2587058 RepID=UPI0016133ADD|nr:DUF805 domain-containing protein [Rhizobium sp. BK377]MBB3461477.1 uncharacterized membrane protein YhaH (DUF805 family) [Rhizobium sp. BK377]
MGFTEAVWTVSRQKYATFSGRASRSECWWFQLFYWLVLLAIFIISILAPSGSRDAPAVTVAIITIVGGIFILAMFLPQVGLQVRRFHDRNISGWWYLALFIAGFVPYLNVISGLTIFVISVLRGTDGPNRFGPDPLHPEAIAEVFA